ncbi:unnamed protein product [Mycena citricolor]|uniref:Mog1p/PsbP-like protein n=1 Tax=Mycena citricolor TaxID=2018698 RepID=A0AAD2HRM9_9AGAR|nr:unnamed protein product [Mycena citricolor]
MSSSTRQLFGGAIVTEAPSGLVDASYSIFSACVFPSCFLSDLRQIPDNQEVFLYPASAVSIIVEILERVESSEDDAAIRFHFDSLAHDNSASSTTVNSVSSIPNGHGDQTPQAIILTGSQSVAKFNKQEQDHVRILMALFRVEHKHVDLVVTFNVPSEPSESNGDAMWNEMQRDFDAFVRALRIIDFGLFV